MNAKSSGQMRVAIPRCRSPHLNESGRHHAQHKGYLLRWLVIINGVDISSNLLGPSRRVVLTREIIRIGVG